MTRKTKRGRKPAKLLPTKEMLLQAVQAAPALVMLPADPVAFAANLAQVAECDLNIPAFLRR